MTKVCVTGYKGRLGSALVRLAGYTPLVCDITKQEEVDAAIDAESPDVIINCAAKTKVDDAEKDYKSFLAVNSEAILNFDYFILKGGKFIQVSTDYVFDGRSGPYKESDIPIHTKLFDRVSEPINAYGWSKFGGETYCYDLPNICVIRTTGLFGSGNDFASYFYDELEHFHPLKVTTSLHGNHTYIPHLVSMIAQLVQLKAWPSILHLASSDVVSRYEFALALANIFGLDTSLVIPVKSIPEWVAKRPTKGGLKVDLAKKLGLPMYSSLDGLKAWRLG